MHQDPNVLAFYLGPRQAYRDVLFSKNETFCSPDCASQLEETGPRTMRTPLGQYDVRMVLEKIPRSQWPDILVVKVDGTLRNLPSNLDVIQCQKVLVLGDTHHLDAPITALLKYAATERFDVLVQDNNRQHVHFFRSAGFTRTAWLPNLHWTPYWRDVCEDSESSIAFVGQTGRFHPWRRALLREVAQRGLPVHVESLPPADAANRYARSSIALNCSLNGDLNLRTFEILAAGGLLLTDELSQQSGLSILFEPGRHVLTYSSIDDLVEKARYYLDHPREALAVRRQGRAQIEANHSPELQRRRFLELVLDGRVDTELEVDDTRSTSVALPVAGLLPRIAGYEWAQEIHRNAAQVRVFDTGLTSAFAADVQDLPRLTVHSRAELATYEREHAVFRVSRPAPAVEHVLVIPAKLESQDIDVLLSHFRGRHLLLDGAFADLSYAEISEITFQLNAWGFSATSLIASAFQRTNSIRALEKLSQVGSRSSMVLDLVQTILEESNDADECYGAGLIADDFGNESLAAECFYKAVRLDRGHDAAGSALARCRKREPHRSPDRKSQSTNGAKRHRYLVVTNLFPPEELGGYGRKMWAFTASLAARGHDVRVLTAATPYLDRTSAGFTPLPVIVDRNLQLTGTWEDGTMKTLQGPEEIRRVALHNRETAIQAVREFSPDACLLGNVDFLETELLRALLTEGIPVLHSIGAPTPGYPVAAAPQTLAYRPLPASEWVAEQIRQAGYPFPRMTVVYPGAQLDDFEREMLPWPHGLRIAYAGLMLPFKGPHVLMQALALLHREGIPFQCELAGDSTSPQFVRTLENFIASNGLTAQVKLLGFLDHDGLQRLFDRSNVFVFPSLVQEAFGISQVEAMAAGLAIVTTATGGAREVVNNECAIVVAPNDPAQLARALRSLYENPAVCERLGDAARKRASQFSVEAGVDRIESATTELLAAIR